MPVTSVNNSSPNMTGLDRFNYGYVAPENSPRYAAHVVLAYLFTCELFFFRAELLNLTMFSLDILEY
jgi:hypothetical protein